MHRAHTSRLQHGSRRGGSSGASFSVSKEYDGGVEVRMEAQVQHASSDMVSVSSCGLTLSQMSSDI